MHVDQNMDVTTCSNDLLTGLGNMHSALRFMQMACTKYEHACYWKHLCMSLELCMFLKNKLGMHGIEIINSMLQKVCFFRNLYLPLFIVILVLVKWLKVDCYRVLTNACSRYVD